MNIILGSGVAALVLLELKPDYVILSQSKSLGGQSSASFPLGPRILHHNLTVAKFLKRIGILDEPRLFRSAYVEDGKYVNELSESAKLNYYHKTRGSVEPNESFLNGGTKEFLGYDVEKIKMIEILIRRNAKRIEEWKFDRIDLFGHNIHGKSDMTVPFNNIINTMDLEKFISLVGKSKTEIEFVEKCKKNITFTLCRRKVRNRFGSINFKDGEFIYFATDKVINRATYINEEYLVLESSSRIPEPWYEKNGLVFEKQCTIKSQIVAELKLDELYGYTMVGRYAQYDHSIKINTVIERFFHE